MGERRPSTKRPGITMTGRQWRTVEALRADGWFVLEADPARWSDNERERVRAALAAGVGELFAEAAALRAARPEPLGEGIVEVWTSPEERGAGCSITVRLNDDQGEDISLEQRVVVYPAAATPEEVTGG
jgi:hypothetical protein